MYSELFELSGYRNIRKIAEGGFGEVYFALQGDIPVAIKRLKYEKAKDSKNRILFENEIQILKKLSHPNLPRFVDSYQSERDCFLVMEYLDGLNLATLLNHIAKENSHPPPAFVFEVLLQLCSALKYLHSYTKDGSLRPVIHGDIKPKNILVTRSAKIVLIDFTVASQEPQERKQLAGTYMYMPSELFTGECPSIQSDVYAMAATFYEMLLLRPLVKEGGTINDVFGYLLSQAYIERIRRMKIMKPLENLLLKGLAFHKQDRFSSAEEFEAGVRECIQQTDIKINQDEIEKFLSKYISDNSGDLE
jgi:serine/threonine protein kinase